MNKDTITGTIKEQAGKLLEDEKLQTEGKVQYLTGSIKDYVGKKKSEMYKALNGFINSFSPKKLVPTEPIPVKV